MVHPSCEELLSLTAVTLSNLGEDAHCGDGIVDADEFIRLEQEAAQPEMDDNMTLQAIVAEIGSQTYKLIVVTYDWCQCNAGRWAGWPGRRPCHRSSGKQTTPR